MIDKLELVSDRQTTQEPVVPVSPVSVSSVPVSSASLPPTTPLPIASLAPVFIAQPRAARGVLRVAKAWCGSARQTLADERGAVTAEYAIVIMAAVAFAGILVAIMRSDAIRAMLVQLVENALGTGG